MSLCLIVWAEGGGCTAHTGLLRCKAQNLAPVVDTLRIIFLSLEKHRHAIILANNTIACKLWVPDNVYALHVENDLLINLILTFRDENKSGCLKSVVHLWIQEAFGLVELTQQPYWYFILHKVVTTIPGVKQ